MSASTPPSPPPATPDQTLLRRLAVFDGGFTLEAAAAIAGEPIETPGSALWGQAPDHLPPGRPSATLVETLHTFASQDVLLREDGPTGTPRYRLPETVRTQGLAQLAATGEFDGARRAHALYFLALAEAIDRRVWGAEQPYWMARLEADGANLRAAFSWADDVGEVDVGLRLAAALWLFWQTRGHVAEGRQWLDRALAWQGGQPWARAAALTVAGLLAWLQDDLGTAEAMLAEARERWGALDGARGLAHAVFILALVAWRRGDVERVIALTTEAFARFRAIDDFAGQPLALVVLAIVACGTGEHTRALALIEEASGLCEVGGFAWGTAAARYYEGEIRTDVGDYPGAAAAYRASIDTSWTLGDPWTTGTGIGGVATVAALCGEAIAAARLFGTADALCAAAGAFLPVMDRGAYGRVVATARATLGPRTFATAYAAGQRLLPETAVAEAVALATRLAGSAAPTGGNAHPSIPAGARVALTPRERDVLRWLIEGQQDAEIAWSLGLSPRTVSDHVLRLRRKLGLPTRTALAIYAVRHRLVERVPRRIP